MAGTEPMAATAPPWTWSPAVAVGVPPVKTLDCDRLTYLGGAGVRFVARLAGASQ